MSAGAQPCCSLSTRSNAALVQSDVFDVGLTLIQHCDRIQCGQQAEHPLRVGGQPACRVNTRRPGDCRVDCQDCRSRTPPGVAGRPPAGSAVPAERGKASGLPARGTHPVGFRVEVVRKLAEETRHQDLADCNLVVRSLVVRNLAVGNLSDHNPVDHSLVDCIHREVVHSQVGCNPVVAPRVVHSTVVENQVGCSRVVVGPRADQAVGTRADHTPPVEDTRAGQDLQEQGAQRNPWRAIQAPQSRCVLAE